MPSFKQHAIVSCGTMRPEVRALADEGFLDAQRILFTAPGLHERPWDLRQELTKQVRKAKASAEKIIVIYGSRCYTDSADPSRDLDALLSEQGHGIKTIAAANCVDMLADSAQREKIAAGDKVYWLTPGWVAHWKFIFKDWDTGKANELFPIHSKAVILDGLGFFEKFSSEKPESLLEFSDWMRIPLEPSPISLDRFRGLLSSLLDSA